MNRLVLWGVAAILLLGGAVAAVAVSERDTGSPYIAGDQPVTEDQVRQKMQTDGWTNVQIVREGRYFQAIGSKDGQARRITIDSQTGRLREVGDDDDDD